MWWDHSSISIPYCAFTIVKLYPSLPFRFRVLQIFSFGSVCVHQNCLQKILSLKNFYCAIEDFYGICFYLIFDLRERNHLRMMNFSTLQALAISHFCWKHFFLKDIFFFLHQLRICSWNLITKWSEDFFPQRRKKNRDEKGKLPKESEDLKGRKKLRKSTEKMDKKSIRENILRWCSCDNKWLFTSILYRTWKWDERE